MAKKFIPTNIGLLTRELRDEKNISANRLSQKFGLSKSNIHAIENNRTNPSLHTFIQIIDFFGYEVQIVDKKTNKLFNKVKLIN